MTYLHWTGFNSGFWSLHFPCDFQAPRLASSSGDYWGRNPWRKRQFPVWETRALVRVLRWRASGAWSNSRDFMDQLKGCKIDSVNVGGTLLLLSNYSTSKRENKNMQFMSKSAGLFSTKVNERIFFWLLSWQARLSWICELPSHCSASFHPSSHLHVAVLIDRATVIPSEFLTRWHGGAGTSQEFILDRREVYVSSFHRLYWWSCFLIMTHSSQISTVQALEAFLKRRLLNGARSHRRGFSWFRFSLF